VPEQPPKDIALHFRSGVQGFFVYNTELFTVYLLYLLLK
jgi:hypothetical protein